MYRVLRQMMTIQHRHSPITVDLIVDLIMGLIVDVSVNLMIRGNDPLC